MGCFENLISDGQFWKLEKVRKLFFFVILCLKYSMLGVIKLGTIKWSRIGPLLLLLLLRETNRNCPSRNVYVCRL